MPINLTSLNLRDKTSIFLYGRSGTGKTHTCNEIINSLDFERTECQIIEIYQNKKQIKEKGQFTKLEVQKKIKEARKTKVTFLNPTSSRIILIIQLGNLVIIDLMGSEKADDRDGILNNQALLSLGNLMRELAQGKTPTFRGSQLNMVLKQCLENSQVIFIGTISGEEDSESLRTTNFINNISAIEYSPINTDDEDDDVSVVELYNQDIDEKRQLLLTLLHKLTKTK